MSSDTAVKLDTGTRPGSVLGAGRPFRDRRLLIALAAVVATGLAINWSWLVAAGIAPILFSVLPCAAMCALGLCMRGGSSCSKQPSPDDAMPRLSDIGSATRQLPDRNGQLFAAARRTRNGNRSSKQH